MSEYAINETGNVIPSMTSTLSVGSRGPLLLQDLHYQDFLSNFLLQKGPERVVHANGAGALGYFQLTNSSLSKYTNAKIFSEIGVKVPLITRFSTVVGELGSADTVNDLRGFAVKFYTSEGNYDLTMLNTKAFNIRDPMLFPSIGRSRFRSQLTYIPCNSMYWDFTSLRPETTFSTFLSHSDDGFPKSYRNLKGFSLNAYKWTGGETGEPVFVKYHMLPDAPPEILCPQSYLRLAGEDPDHFKRDLRDKINAGEFPTWTLSIQLVRKEDLEKFSFDPFDPTKIWPEDKFPLIQVGQMTLDSNPDSYVEQIEKVAYSPGNLIPGIELSPDRILQGRIFAYSTTQRHRLGKDFNKIPINFPLHQNFDREIYCTKHPVPKYFPNSMGIISHENVKKCPRTRVLVKEDKVLRVDRGEEDNYSQLDVYWRRELTPESRLRAIKAIAASLSKASEEIQRRSLERNWDPVNAELSSMLRMELEIIKRTNEHSKL